MSSNESLETIKSRVKEVIEKVLTTSNVDIEELKEEVWNDLSALYYKYEVDEQKRAFRKVMHDICEKIKEGKWDTVYKKLYREEQKEKTF